MSSRNRAAKRRQTHHRIPRLEVCRWAKNRNYHRFVGVFLEVFVGVFSIWIILSTWQVSHQPCALIAHCKAPAGTDASIPSNGKTTGSAVVTVWMSVLHPGVVKYPQVFSSPIYHWNILKQQCLEADPGNLEHETFSARLTSASVGVCTARKPQSENIDNIPWISLEYPLDVLNHLNIQRLWSGTAVTQELIFNCKSTKVAA